MKILITGASGQLGNELKLCLDGNMHSALGLIPEIYRDVQCDFIDHDELDIADQKAVENWFRSRAYDLVINCAAYTNVDGCEKDEASAFKVNAIGPLNLARVCQIQQAKFIQVSTDYVFPGNEQSAREESDQVRPISAYGRSKHAGEILSLSECARTFVIRTAWLYGLYGKNFVKTMRKFARQNGKLSVVDDQYGNPTNAADLAHAILLIASTENYGIYHCTNDGIASWFEFAKAIVEFSEIHCICEPISSKEYKRRFPNSADRPHWSALENKHLKETVGNCMRPWKEALFDHLLKLKELEKQENSAL